MTGNEQTHPRTRTGTPAEAVRDAVALQRNGRLDEAAQIYAAVLAVEPHHFDSLHNLSLIRRQQERLDEALALALRARDAGPAVPQAHDSLGSALLRLNRPREAIACYQEAIALKPDFIEAHSNLAAALIALNRSQEAITSYRRALAFNPNLAEVQYFESLEHLKLGEFDAGWRQHEWRWLRKDAAPFRRNFSQPLWLGGESLNGKTILLHADQGIGCALQFVRYLPLVAAQAGKVVLEVHRPLVPLLRDMAGAAAVCARGDPLPSFDRHCPLMSLPLAFGTQVATIPAAVPYIFAPPPDTTAHLDRTPPGRAVTAGLTWAGNRSHSNDYNRSVPLRQLVPLLELPGVRFVSLQQELREGDAQMLETAKVARPGERLRNFAETAAIVASLDLVITVDTAVAHLAGALGKPVWILLPFSADWRWFVEREDSPFYPTARLFRQPAIDDWDSVVARVVAALRDRAQG